MRRAALLLELLLYLALAALLGVAAFKFTRVLARLDASPVTSLAFALVFLGAVGLAAKKARSVVNRLRRNEDDGISRKR